MKICKKCGKKIGFFDKWFEFNDGSVICYSCDNTTEGFVNVAETQKNCKNLPISEVINEIKKRGAWEESIKLVDDYGEIKFYCSLRNYKGRYFLDDDSNSIALLLPDSNNKYDPYTLFDFKDVKSKIDTQKYIREKIDKIQKFVDLLNTKYGINVNRKMWSDIFQGISLDINEQKKQDKIKNLIESVNEFDKELARSIESESDWNKKEKLITKAIFLIIKNNKNAWEVTTAFAQRYKNAEAYIESRKQAGGGKLQESVDYHIDDNGNIVQNQQINACSYVTLQEFFNFMDLLETKYGMNLGGFYFSNVHDKWREILNLAFDEFKIQKDIEEYKKFKEIILSEKPKTKEEYIYSLLRNFGEGYNTTFFVKLMNEQGFALDKSIYSSVSQIREKLRLDSFEKSLLQEKNKKEINLDLMGGHEFELFLGMLFQKMGFKVINTKLSGDQGADLIIERFGEKTAVQAKRYSNAVGNGAIQEIIPAKNHYKCDKALVITTSYFTKGAMELAQSNNVELWDRNKLKEMIKRYGNNDVNNNNEIEADEHKEAMEK